MKKILILLASLMVLVSCNNTKKNEVEKDNKKVLVLYYSQTGATRTVAEEIQKQMNADIEEIYAIDPYNGDFQATIERCQKEMADNILPEIEDIKSVIDEYDVVFLGYPIWFGKAAPPMLSFVKKYDLSKVKVVPFCTFGSGGKETGLQSLYDLGLKEVECVYGVRNARIKSVPSEIDYFLKSNGLLEGEFENKGDFDEPKLVGEKEIAIFNQACGNYPMLHATATNYCTRKVNAGTEYLFEANDQSFQGASIIKVIVGVYDENDLKPEFLEVIR